MPERVVVGTAKSLEMLSWMSPTGDSGVGLPRVHPASDRTLSICTSRSIDSWSWKQPRIVYPVPLNALRASWRAEGLFRDLGVLIRSSSASAWTVRCNASARCDSADAACVLAKAMSRSKELASVRAPFANVRALAANASALVDFSTALAEASLATVADLPAASAESLAASARAIAFSRICSSWECNSVSALEARNSNIPSPATPPTTNRRPRYEAGIAQLFSFDGPTSFLLNRRIQRFSAIVASGASNTTPTPTTMLEVTSQKNHLSLLLASLSRTASTASGSENHRDREVKWALIALAFLGLIAVCEVTYILLWVKV